MLPDDFIAKRIRLTPNSQLAPLQQGQGSCRTAADQWTQQQAACLPISTSVSLILGLLKIGRNRPVQV